MTRIRFEWFEHIPNPAAKLGELNYTIGAESSREVDWPSVPHGDDIVRISEGDARLVGRVLWGLDGSAVVRLK